MVGAGEQQGGPTQPVEKAEEAKQERKGPAHEKFKNVEAYNDYYAGRSGTPLEAGLDRQGQGSKFQTDQSRSKSNLRS